MKEMLAGIVFVLCAVAYSALAASAATPTFSPDTIKQHATTRGTQTGSSRTQRKLDSIIIPSREYRAVSITDALKDLAENSQQQDPGKVGVIIISNIGDISKVPPITLNVKKFSLGNAIRIICEVCQLKYRVGDNTVIIRGRNDPE